MLCEPKASLVTLDAGRKDRIEPEPVREEALAKPCERPRHADLEPDVAVAAEDGEGNDRVAIGVELVGLGGWRGGRRGFVVGARRRLCAREKGAEAAAHVPEQGLWRSVQWALTVPTEGRGGPTAGDGATMGAHQFRCPKSRIVAGTSSARTRVASSAMASAMPTPVAWSTTTLASEKAMNTLTMIAAALVMRPAVVSRPCATAASLSPVSS